MSNIKYILRNTCLPELSREVKYFSTSTIRGWLRIRDCRVKNETLNRYLAELVQNRAVFDSGRGWYSCLANPLIVNPAPVADVIRRVEKAFPLLAFTCWSTEQVNPYMHHLLAKFVTFIYADKDLMPAVYDELSGWKDWRLYLNPSSKEAKKIFRVEDRTIVIRAETSESPLGDGHAAPFEKLLVDLAIEIETLPIMSKGDFQDMARRVVTNGRVSMAALARYAHRNHRRLENVFGKDWSINGTK